MGIVSPDFEYRLEAAKSVLGVGVSNTQLSVVFCGCVVPNITDIPNSIIPLYCKQIKSN